MCNHMWTNILLKLFFFQSRKWHLKVQRKRWNSSDDFNSRTGGGGGVPWFHWSWYNNRHFLRVSHLPEIYEAGVAEPRSQLDTKSYLHGQLLTDISKTFRLSLLNGRFLGDSLGYFTLFYYFTPMEQAPLATYWYQVSFLIKSDNFMNNYLMNHRITPLLVLKRKA